MDGGEFEAAAGDVPLIGIFLHGGGYCHMSAHEKAPTSQIPARLIKVSLYTRLCDIDIDADIASRTRRSPRSTLSSTAYSSTRPSPPPSRMQLPCTHTSSGDTSASVQAKGPHLGAPRAPTPPTMIPSARAKRSLTTSRQRTPTTWPSRATRRKTKLFARALQRWLPTPTAKSS